MLHTVNKSPFSCRSLETCLSLAAPGSDILLIEDAVYGAIAGTGSAVDVEQALSSCKVYVLEADLKARGIELDKLIPGIKRVGYDGFVELAASNSKVQSWF